MKNLVIFGVGEQAEIVNYYFTEHTDYNTVAFTIDDDLITIDHFLGKPIVPFNDVAKLFPPQHNDLFIAVGYSKINQLRKDKYLFAKSLGYHMPSYISAHATILNDRKIGDNCLILENNTLQPFVTIGNNVTIWSGNHIGHHSIIKDHCFITSHVVVSGGVEIGEQCFIGVNATLRDHIKIGDRCVIGAGTLILADAEPDGLYIGKATERSTHLSTKLKNI